ncbi:MAG: hypothetical protein AMXMBFR59_26530 [Rhodanobacteraceae bacterium]
MYAESHRPVLVLLAALTMASAQAADEQVFEPGTKHVCVPAANGEGWDCRSTDAAPAVPAESAAKPRELRVRSSSEAPDDVSPTSAATDSGPATPPPDITAPGASSRSVPHYLLAPEARASAAAATPAAEPPTAAPTAPPAPPERVPAASVPEPPVAPPVAAADATPEPATPPPRMPASSASVAPPTAEPPRPPPPPSAAAPAAPAAPPADATAAAGGTAPLGAAEFRRLGDSRYVIELASGRQRDAVESEVARPARGEVYLLSLTRDGEAWYLAVWGDFESVDAARNARAEALANGAVRVGWPRRVGPLKQELR